MIKILGKKVAKATKWLTLWTTEFQKKDGTKSEWDWVQRKKEQKAVIIVPIFSGNRVGLQKEFRVPLEGYEYGFPAGLIDDGETIEQTAIRELKEETGCTVKRVIKKSPFVVNSAGLSDEKVSVVFVEAEVGGESSTESSEDIEFKVYDITDIGSMLEDPSKTFGAKAWVILYMLLETYKMSRKNS
jgi:ADP-ribose pyrophosphatase